MAVDFGNCSDILGKKHASPDGATKGGSNEISFGG
jgi:hypothetical protein